LRSHPFSLTRALRIPPQLFPQFGLDLVFQNFSFMRQFMLVLMFFSYLSGAPIVFVSLIVLSRGSFSPFPLLFFSPFGLFGFLPPLSGFRKFRVQRASLLWRPFGIFPLLGFFSHPPVFRHLVRLFFFRFFLATFPCSGPQRLLLRLSDSVVPRHAWRLLPPLRMNKRPFLASFFLLFLPRRHGVPKLPAKRRSFHILFSHRHNRT